MLHLGDRFGRMAEIPLEASLCVGIVLTQNIHKYNCKASQTKDWGNIVPQGMKSALVL